MEFNNNQVIIRRWSPLDNDPNPPDGEDREFYIVNCAGPEEARNMLDGKIQTWIMGKRGTLYVRIAPEIELCGANGPCPGLWRAYGRFRLVPA